MNKYISLALVAISFFCSSCEDFLQKEPKDFGNETNYLKTVPDLKLYANTFYTLFPTHTSWKAGIYSVDDNSDNQSSFGANSNFYPGVKMVPNLNDSEWKFETIRECNYFLNLITERLERGELIGSQKEIDHYIGEVYFFRAYDYFRLLTTIGDVPIIDKELSNDMEELRQNSKRRPRNEVARFIISDLEKAVNLMESVAPHDGRLNKDCARIMLARVALYEATWLKYHQGTCFAPGNPKWPGAKMYPDFEFQAGDINAEINFFLDKAIAASDIVAGTYPLYKDYAALFTSVETADIPEIILAKHYVSNINGHCASHALKQAGKTGYTRPLVESFLMIDGLPIYKSEDYLGDESLENVIDKRDLRLVTSVGSTPPRIAGRAAEFCPTGYEVKKWLSKDPNQGGSVTSGTAASPIFRSAEARCIYLEAYYERYRNLGGNCDTYWKELRVRAGVNPNYGKTIEATVLSKENDLATQSHGIFVDETLYNIRRERRCEFIAEGMRLNDLKRWRALDGMQNYEIQGLNLWDFMFGYYYVVDATTGKVTTTLTSDLVSQKVEGDENSKYIHVFKVAGGENSAAYSGYNFPKAHYLEPIPVNEILLTSETPDPDTSNIYQNPGWPNFLAGMADYSFDYD